MTASDYKELVSYFRRRMKSSSTRPNCIFGNRHLSPIHCLKIENPQVIEVSNSFSAEDHEMRIEKFGRVVGALPGGRMILLGSEFRPLFRLPVEDIDGIESLFGRPTAAEDDDAIVSKIVIHGAVRAIRRCFSLSFDFSPLHSDGVEGPDVVHIVRI